MIPNKLLPFVIYCAKPVWKWHILNAFFVFVGSALEALTPYFIMLILDAIQSGPSHEAIEQVLHVVLLFIVFRVVISIVWHGAYLSRSQASRMHVYTTRNRLLEALLKYDYAYFQNRFSGQLSQKITDANTGAGGIIFVITNELLYALTLPIAAAIMMATIHPLLGVLLFSWIVIYTLMNLYISRFQEMRSNTRARLRAAFFGHVVDVLTNMLSIKLFSNTLTNTQEIKELNKRVTDALYLQRVTESNIQSTRTLYHTLLSVAILLLSCWLWAEGSITAAAVATAIAYANQTGNKCSAIATSISMMFEDAGTASSAIDTLSYTPKLIDNTDKKMRKTAGSIQLKDIGFHFGDTEKSVFNHLNIDIPTGTKVALIGPSGAGKSTLVNLIMRLFDPLSGKVCFDNRDISKFTQDSVRSHIAMIPQDTSLFHRSLMENIRYGQPNATNAQVIAAAKKAHAHDFIQELPAGYETLVGERGIKLSGGQRQRIAIARAILKDAPILILDEATSALDSESERLIQESLAQVMENKTVIAIAHRLSTIAHMDRIIVMHEGQIIEDGSHKELLEKDGLYAKLWRQQSSGFLK